MATTKELTAALKIAKIAVETIQEAGPSGIPSGHLYAAMMSVFPAVETYNSMIDLLVRSGLITNENHLLRATS